MLQNKTNAAIQIILYSLRQILIWEMVICETATQTVETVHISYLNKVWFSETGQVTRTSNWHNILLNQGLFTFSSGSSLFHSSLVLSFGQAQSELRTYFFLASPKASWRSDHRQRQAENCNQMTEIKHTGPTAAETAVRWGRTPRNGRSFSTSLPFCPIFS